MLEGEEFFNDTDWIKRSAEETSVLLADRFGAEKAYKLFLIGCMTSRAILEERPDDLIFWGCVFSRLRRGGLNETSRRELQLLLDESKRWGQ